MRRDLEELRCAFEGFKRLPFPVDSDDDAVSQLHAELIEYNGFVAGLVVTLLEGGDVPPHLLTFDYQLKACLKKIIKEAPPSAVADAEKYLQYLDALGGLIDIASDRALSQQT